MKRFLGPGAGLALSIAIICLAFFALALPRAWWNDDAFITFRYAANLATGHGFVWNTVPPERVEGTSSLAWTWLGALAIRLGLDPLTVAFALGSGAGAAALVLVGFRARRVLGASALTALLAAALLCMQRQWVLWSVSGMEITAAAFVLLASTLRLLQEAQRLDLAPGPHTPRAALRAGLGSGALFFLATLLRPESPLLHLAAGIGLVIANRDRLRLVIASGLVHLTGLALLTAWRVIYFGQILPNTFYVKVGAVQLDRGLRFLGEFALQNHAWLWVALVAVASPWLWRRARCVFATLTLQVLVWCVWLAVIGGDQWEFRLLVPILPALALLTALAVAQLATALATPGHAATAPSPPRRVITGVVAAALLVSQGVALARPFRSFGDVFSSLQLDQGARYMGLEAAILAPYLGPDVRICTGWAGVLPYMTGAWHFDPWGLNDPEIARAPLDPTRVVFHQRHAVWQDVVARDVLVCDLFNHFLFPRPFDPVHVRNVVPWVDPGVPVYSVRLPAGQHWIFTSARPRSEVEAHLARHGLHVLSVHALPPGWPTLGG